jgi:hypothetical protein
MYSSIGCGRKNLKKDFILGFLALPQQPEDGRVIE